MRKQSTLLAGVAAFSMIFGGMAGEAIAQMAHDDMEPVEQTGEFQRVEQPLWVKGAVTAGGLGLVGLELWWFLFSKPKSRRATTQGGVQEITVTVDGGYEPSQIVVQVGQPVKLNFDRRDPSSCLEEVRFPDFRIAKELPLNQVTPIEFTPDKPGHYEFTCGMNMFRGVVDVQSEVHSDSPAIAPNSLHEDSSSTPHTTPPTHYPDHPADHAVDPRSYVTATITSSDIQEATVTVAKGYQPRRVIVEAGHPVRLHFDRHNPSHCYDQLLIPEFAIAVDLTPETTTVEFTPEQTGEYEFMCGMAMNRGVIEVREKRSENRKAIAHQPA